MAWLEVSRSLHILFAVLWAGGALFYQFHLTRRFSDEQFARAFWNGAMHGPYFGATSLGTVVFGLTTFFAGTYDVETYGFGFHVLGIGIAMGTIGMLIGFLGHLPVALKVDKALKTGEPLGPLMAKDHRLNIASLVTVGIAFLAMVTFRLFG